MQSTADFPNAKLPKDTQSWLEGMVAAVAPTAAPAKALAPSVAIRRAAELGGQYLGYDDGHHADGDWADTYHFSFKEEVPARVFRSWLSEETGVPEEKIKLEAPTPAPRPPELSGYDVFVPCSAVSVRAETLDPATCTHPPTLWVRKNWHGGGRIIPSPEPIFTARCYCGKAGSLVITPGALSWK